MMAALFVVIALFLIALSAGSNARRNIDRALIYFLIGTLFLFVAGAQMERDHDAQDQTLGANR
jgi:multisubunit Na+/H+ antiporter MnhB subunit